MRQRISKADTVALQYATAYLDCIMLKDGKMVNPESVLSDYERALINAVETQAYELVIPIRDMSLYDACDKN